MHRVASSISRDGHSQTHLTRSIYTVSPHSSQVKNLMGLRGLKELNVCHGCHASAVGYDESEQTPAWRSSTAANSSRHSNDWNVVNDCAKYGRSAYFSHGWVGLPGLLLAKNHCLHQRTTSRRVKHAGVASACRCCGHTFFLANRLDLLFSSTTTSLDGVKTMNLSFLQRALLQPTRCVLGQLALSGEMVLKIPRDTERHRT